MTLGGLGGMGKGALGIKPAVHDIWLLLHCLSLVHELLHTRTCGSLFRMCRLATPPSGCRCLPVPGPCTSRGCCCARMQAT